MLEIGPKPAGFLSDRGISSGIYPLEFRIYPAHLGSKTA